MKIKITGASGYLGKLISEALIQKNHEVSAIPRKLIYDSIDELKAEIAGTDVIINLAGAPILQRWNKINKTLIYDSRIRTTQNLVSAINLLPQEQQPRKFISASAIGIYKPGISHSEESKNFDHGFVGDVVQNWEATLDELPETMQTIIFRIGLVIGKNAKTIKNLLLPIKFYLGAIIGNGNQSFPFVHENDVSRVFTWAVEEYNQNNIFNLAAPEKITNKDFTKAFAKKLHRPVFFFIPKFILKIVLGEAETLLTESPSVEPKNLINAGFIFNFPNINKALDDIMDKPVVD